MPEKAFTATIDRRAEERYLARFTSSEVDKVLQIAAREGGKAGVTVMRSDAPVGTAQRLSQYYRRKGLDHGTFRRSVRSAPIRGRGSAIRGLQGRTVGVVIGPMGSNGFTRAWLEEGFLHKGGTRVEGTHWVERAADIVLGVAREASDAVLEMYGRG